MRREKLLTLREAAVWLKEELGVNTSARALRMWGGQGRYGAKLEIVNVSGVWHTTPDAIRRFLSACTQAHSASGSAEINELKL